MRHIKMYESWLNEASGANVPSTLDKGLQKLQSQFDSQLIDLSSYGALSSQVRSYIDRYRSQYLNSAVWNSIGTEAGLNKSINDFKESQNIPNSVKYPNVSSISNTTIFDKDELIL